MVKLDVYLNIRYASNVILRSIVWKIGDEPISTAIIGCRVLESQDCDNRSMLMAARDRYGSDIDVNARLMDDVN